MEAAAELMSPIDCTAQCLCKIEAARELLKKSAAQVELGREELHRSLAGRSSRGSVVASPTSLSQRSDTLPRLRIFRRGETRQKQRKRLLFAYFLGLLCSPIGFSALQDFRLFIVGFSYFFFT